MKQGVDYIAVAVCTMCHDGNGNYLVGQRSPKCKDEHYTWHPIGTGSIEHNESMEAAVKREVKEECGADATEITFIGVRELFREHDNQATHWVMFDYLAKVDPNQVVIQEPDKCLGFQWCTIDTIPTPHHSAFPDFLEKYKDVL
jgi:8-oxo-dGTP diphosphatase